MFGAEWSTCSQTDQIRWTHDNSLSPLSQGLDSSMVHVGHSYGERQVPGNTKTSMISNFMVLKDFTLLVREGELFCTPELICMFISGP
ncbi:hypothetical protein TNCV_394951 [Trichonephila clavipes]|nr:hypothetical protein TNCV_394951 [Trichonephila clavipes]